MSHQESSIETPEPPSSLPKYLREGIPKQDDETLRETIDWIEAILDARDQEITEEDIPDSGRKVGQRGTTWYVELKVKCSDETCHCAQGGDERHGPYVYKYWYENGTLQSDYEGKPSEVDIDY